MCCLFLNVCLPSCGQSGPVPTGTASSGSRPTPFSSAWRCRSCHRTFSVSWTQQDTSTAFGKGTNHYYYRRRGEVFTRDGKNPGFSEKTQTHLVLVWIFRDFMGILHQFDCKLTSLEHASIYLGRKVCFNCLGPKIIESHSKLDIKAIKYPYFA